MNKRILSIVIVLSMCLALFPLPAAAAGTDVAAEYSEGAVTVTGTGFTNGVSYTIRIVDTANSSIKAMGQVTAGGSGNISASITTGALEEPTNYIVYVNNPDGTLAGSVHVTFKPVNATAVALDKTTAIIEVNGSVTLIATVQPGNAKNKNVTWSSSDTSIATVENGVVTGVKAGTAVISVMTEDGGHRASCRVTVVNPTVAVTGVELNKQTANITVGGTVTLIATVQPGNASNKNVAWSSSDTSAATVANGVVTGVKAGTAVITVTTVDGGFTAICSVSVTVNSGGNGDRDRDKDTPPTPPATVPVPSAPSAVAAKIEVAPELGADGAARASISSQVMDTLIQQAAAAASDTRAAIEIRAMAPAGSQSVSVAIPASAFQTIAETNNTSIMIDTGIAAITFDEKAVDAISKDGSKGEVGLSVAIVEPTMLSPQARELVGNRPVYDFSITNDGKKVSSFDGGKAQVSIPYTLQPGEDPDSVVLFRINSAGELESVRCVYNEKTGCIEAVLSHFSEYAIACNKVTFRDVPPAAWYAKAVNFIASRGITSGIGNGNFGPSEKLTREQFLVMLMKAYNIAPDNETSDNFDDVGNNYAAPYISAAKRLGISAGIGDNKFGPAKEISRQEMFRMLYNALKVIDELPTAKANLTIEGYEDLSDVAGWALPAMTLMVESGLITGTGGNKLSPLSVSDRAAMAQIIYNLLK